MKQMLLRGVFCLLKHIFCQFHARASFFNGFRFVYLRYGYLISTDWFVVDNRYEARGRSEYEPYICRILNVFILWPHGWWAASCIPLERAVVDRES